MKRAAIEALARGPRVPAGWVWVLFPRFALWLFRRRVDAYCKLRDSL
jgi:hypothetical protein